MSVPIVVVDNLNADTGSSQQNRGLAAGLGKDTKVVPSLCSTLSEGLVNKGLEQSEKYSV